MTLQKKMVLLALAALGGQLLAFWVEFGDVQALLALYQETHGEAASPEFRAAMEQVVRDGLYVMLFAVPVVMGVILYLSLSVARGVRNLAHTLDEAVRTRDLTRRMPESGNDELTAIARAYNRLMEEFAQVIGALDEAMERLRVATDTARGVSRELDQAVEEERAEMDQVAAAMNEMAASVQEIARNAASTAEATERADRDAAQSMAVVRRNQESIAALAREIEDTAGILERLSEESAGIAGMLDSIRGIAEQTNLLALNAAIEAARAGEQGRGFAVVADEVRTLAQRTQNSTSEIEDVVEGVLGRIRDAVAAMEAGRARAEDSVAHAREVNEALEAIRSAVARINEMNLQVATATEQQGAVAEEVNRSIVRVAELSGTTRACAERVRDAGGVVETLADRLGGLMQRFRAGGRTE